MSTILNQERFNQIQDNIKTKRGTIYEMRKQIKNLEKEIIESKEELYSLCTHEFYRECTMGGCYPEYEWICKYCNKSK